MVHHILWQINKPYLSHSECNLAEKKTVQCIKWLENINNEQQTKGRLNCPNFKFYVTEKETKDVPYWKLEGYNPLPYAVKITVNQIKKHFENCYSGMFSYSK